MRDTPTATVPTRRRGKTEQALLKRAIEALDSLALEDDLPTPVRDAATAAAEADDLVAAMQGMAAAGLALEALEKLAKELKLAIRKALTPILQESGVGTLHLPHHTVSVVTTGPGVDVSDPKQVPQTVTAQGTEFALWVRPEPKIDMAALRAAVDAGANVPGTVRTNGSEPYLSHRAKAASKPKRSRAPATAGGEA